MFRSILKDNCIDNSMVVTKETEVGEEKKREKGAKYMMTEGDLLWVEDIQCYIQMMYDRIVHLKPIQGGAKVGLQLFI